MPQPKLQWSRPTRAKVSRLAQTLRKRNALLGIKTPVTTELLMDQAIDLLWAKYFFDSN